MEPYQVLYYKLFNATTRVIEVLQEIQKEAEELYIAAEEESTALVCRDGSPSPSPSQE